MEKINSLKFAIIFMKGLERRLIACSVENIINKMTKLIKLIDIIRYPVRIGIIWMILGRKERKA